MNMSYCRFENTYADLADCLDALDNDEVSDSQIEKKYCKKLIALCKKIVEFHGDKFDEDEET